MSYDKPKFLYNDEQLTIVEDSAKNAQAPTPDPRRYATWIKNSAEVALDLVAEIRWLRQKEARLMEYLMEQSQGGQIEVNDLMRIIHGDIN